MYTMPRTTSRSVWVLSTVEAAAVPGVLECSPGASRGCGEGGVMSWGGG